MHVSKTPPALTYSVSPLTCKLLHALSQEQAPGDFNLFTRSYATAGADHSANMRDLLCSARRVPTSPTPTGPPPSCLLPCRHGGAVRSLKTLLRGKLVHHDGSKYDGYRLTNMGYDFLALRALMARGSIAAVGSQIGVGKESDVFEVSLRT